MTYGLQMGNEVHPRIDEVARLLARIERLEAALRKIAQLPVIGQGDMYETARAALAKEKGDAT